MNQEKKGEENEGASLEAHRVDLATEAGVIECPAPGPPRVALDHVGKVGSEEKDDPAAGEVIPDSKKAEMHRQMAEPGSPRRTE